MFMFLSWITGTPLNSMAILHIVVATLCFEAGSDHQWCGEWPEWRKDECYKQSSEKLVRLENGVLVRLSG